MRGARTPAWIGMAAAASMLAVAAPAAGQVETAARWVADAPEVGTTFSFTLSLGLSDEPHVFLARKSAGVDDPDRVVLLLTAVGSIDGGPPRRVTISSSTCADEELRARVGEDGTCLVTRVPFGGRWTLLARPLAAPDDGTLRADFGWIKPAGEELLLGSFVPVQARRIDLGGEVNFLSGERELYSVEIPGGIASSTMWVEQRLFTFGFGGVLDIVPVVAALADEHRSGQMAWIGEEDWPTHPTFRNATVWAGGRFNPLSNLEERGRLRVVRNDPSDDTDGDGLGRGLEQAVHSCDRGSDQLAFFEETLVMPGPPVKKGPGLPGAGPIPIPDGEPHFFDCGRLVRPNEEEGQAPYPDNPLIRLQDTDQDGHTDYDEVLGRDEPDGALSRWGANPHRKDLFIESDYYDPDATSLAECTDATRSLWTVRAPARGSGSGAMVTRLQRELWLRDYAASRSQRCLDDPDERCPIDEWSNPDGTGGVAMHFDLGPPPAGVPFDPLDTRFMDLGGGSCIPGKLDGRELKKQRARRRFLADRRKPYVHYALMADGGQEKGRVFTCNPRKRGMCQHELGHELALEHYGPNPERGSRQNNKFNYFSRMNYRYQDTLAGEGVLLFSTGEFAALGDGVEADVLDVTQLDERSPLGADRDLGFLDVAPTSPDNRICEPSTSPACTDPDVRSDVDWDGSGAIEPGGVATTRPIESHRQALQNAARLLKKPVARFGRVDVGHAAAVTGEGDERERVYTAGGVNAKMPGVSLAVRGYGDRDSRRPLVLAYGDTKFRLNVATGGPIDAESCRVRDDNSCGKPEPNLSLGADTDPPLPFSVVLDDNTGEPISTLHVALLELRDEARILAVVRPPFESTLVWGFVEAEDEDERTGRWLFTRKGRIDDVNVVGRVALERDPDSGAVVMLAHVFEPRIGDRLPGNVIEAVLDDPLDGEWRLTRPRVDEGSGLGPWEVTGPPGLVAWSDDGSPDRRLYAAYGRRSDHEMRFVRRVSFGQWTTAGIGCGPTTTGNAAARSVSLEVSHSRGEDRIWAVWGRYPGRSGPSGRRLRGNWRTRSAVFEGFCDRSDTYNAFNVWADEHGAAGMVWDDRGTIRAIETDDEDPEQFDGLRVSLDGATGCGSCYQGDDDTPALREPPDLEGEPLRFYSDGVGPGESHPSGVECEVRLCHDDLDNPLDPNGFVQGGVLYQPFFDPLTTRIALRDYLDYRHAGRKLCTFVRPGPDERCPDPVPATHSLPGEPEPLESELFPLP